MSGSVVPTMHSTLEQHESGSPAGPDRVERGCALAIAAFAAFAAIALLAWKLIPAVHHWPAVWQLMHPTTALGMLLVAAIIWASETQAAAWRRNLSWVGAGLLALFSLWSLGLEFAAGRLLLNDWWEPGSSAMSAQSCVGMLLLALLLPVARVYRGPLSIAADVLTLLLVDFVLVMLMGYLFSLVSFFGESDAIRIAPLSFLCFLLGTVVVLLRRSHGGALAVLRGGAIGSRIVRAAIPLALLLPLALSLIRAYVVSAGLLEAAYATAASISVVCLCVVLLALLMGWRINRLEQEVRTLLQRRSDAQLQESQQRYMDLVEQSISGFVVRRPDGRLILVNEAYRRMTGYSREELLQLSARDLVVDQGVLERVRRLEPGESAHIETFLKRKDGSLLEVEYVTQRMRDGNLQSVLLDISHRKQLQKQRDDSERRYAELVDQAQEGISVRRPAGGFVFVNETFCTMLGYSRDELLKLSIQDVVHPEDAETTQQVQQMTHGGHLRLQKRMLRKDGAVIHAEVSAKRLRNGDIQSTIQDVTGRKQAEERFRAMVEGSPSAMLMVDARGAIVMCNPQAQRLFGYSPSELLGQPVEMLLPDRFRKSHPSMRASYGRDPQVRAMGVGRELFGLHKDGREVPVEIGLNPITTGEGQFVLATIIDISERKRAAEQMRAAEHRYETAINALAEGVAVLDRQGRVIAFNKSATRILAMTRDQFTGRVVQDPDWQLQREDGTPFPLDEHPVVITLATGEDRDDVVLVAALPDGTRRTLTVSSRGLDPDKDGKPTTVLASFRDITQQRQHERKLRDMSRRLGEAQETERRAIARELHDEVGQSLTATRINLRDLSQQATDLQLQKRLGDTEEIIAELLGKVRQMSLDLHPSVLDDLGLVPALRWCVRTRAGGSPMQVRMEVPESLPRFTDMVEITLFRVFQEALSNALKHAAAAQLDVRLEYRDSRLWLNMRDDGKGFDAEAARRAALSGKSLGLLGMQERVRLAGGEIVMDSAPGKGTEIRVTLLGEER